MLSPPVSHHPQNIVQRPLYYPNQFFFSLKMQNSSWTEGFSWGIVFRSDVQVSSDMLVKSSSVIGPPHRCKQTRWLTYYIICHVTCREDFSVFLESNFRL